MRLRRLVLLAHPSPGSRTTRALGLVLLIAGGVLLTGVGDRAGAQVRRDAPVAATRPAAGGAIRPTTDASVARTISAPGTLLRQLSRPAVPIGRRPGATAPGATPAPAPAAPPAPAASPRVAVLATKPGSGRTELIFQSLDSATVSAPVAAFDHLPDSDVRGTVLPQTNDVLVITGTDRRKDPAFGSSLLLLREKQDTQLVVDRVYQGTRPLVLDDGRAFVQRGQEGDEPSEADLAAGRLRVDHLTIEQINLAGDGPKVLSRFDGYIAFIAGALRHEIFVYRVGPDGADIIGIEADSGRERTIERPLPPFARDFSIDAQSQGLLFTNADQDEPGQWEAVRLDVSPPAAAAPVVSPRTKVAVKGKTERLERAAHPALIPTAWLDRGVAMNGNRAGLQLSRGATSQKVGFTGGADVVREFFFTNNETWALALHRQEGRFSEPIIIRANTMDVQRIAAPADSHLDLAGVLDQGNAAKPAIRQIQPAAAAVPAIRINPRMLKVYRPQDLDGPGADRDDRSPR